MQLITVLPLLISSEIKKVHRKCINTQISCIPVSKFDVGLFFSASSISQFGDPKKLPGGYTMEMSCKDSTYYFPIALDLFYSVEMEGRTGISGSIAVHGTPPPCGGYCGCCSVSRN